MESIDIHEFLKEVTDKVHGDDKGVAGDNAIQIKGKIYKIKLVPWQQGIDLWELMVKKLLPSIGNFIDDRDADELDQVNTFTDAFVNISRNLDGRTLNLMTRVLLDGCTVDNKPIDLDAEFTGNYGNWIRLLIFALKENYGSFFGDGWQKGLLTDLLAKKASSQAE